MKLRRALSVTLYGVLSLTLFSAAQQITVQPEGGKAAVFGRADLEALPHVKVTVGKPDAPIQYEGILLRSLLEKAGITFGETLKGKRIATCLLVEAADGYRAVIALPELDPAFTDKQVLLVFLREGKPLDDKEGHYRIVIPDEKRMARWVRQVTAMKVVAVQ